MKYFVGIDLHSDNCFIGMSDEEDNRIIKKKVPNNLDVILMILNPHKQKIQGVVVESTYNWYWLVDGLMDAGYKVYLSNPAGNIQYSGLKFSDDKWDSFWLAHLLRLGILKTGHIYPKQTRPIRDLLRKRIMLVRHRTAHFLSLGGMVHRNTGESMNANQIRKIEEGYFGELFEDEHLSMAACCDHKVIEFFNGQVKEIEKAVLKQVKLMYPFEKLLTAPGIGKILGLTIMLETGDMGRFATVSDYSSYCRCVSSTRISNGKKKGEGNKRNGNKYLAWSYVEAANFMKRFSPIARSWYQRKEAQTNRVVATKALSNKIARASYYIIKDQVPFNPKMLFVPKAVREKM